MTEPHDDIYGDRLRQALQAEADTVSPTGDGLERIRTRVNSRSPAWFGWWRPALALCGAAVFATGGVAVAAPLLRPDAPKDGVSVTSTAEEPRHSHGAAAPDTNGVPRSEPGREPPPQETTEPPPSAGASNDLLLCRTTMPKGPQPGTPRPLPAPSTSPDRECVSSQSPAPTASPTPGEDCPQGKQHCSPSTTTPTPKPRP